MTALPPHHMQPDAIANFLKTTAPDSAVIIEHSLLRKTNFKGEHFLKTIELQIHCEVCDGERNFEYRGDPVPLDNLSTFHVFLTYRCKNCADREKIFAIAGWLDDSDGCWVVQKVGEIPKFGVPISPTTMKIVGADRDQFLKGRNCEILGLGIGAFAYYRRVVETQKNRIYDEILRAIQYSQADPELAQQIHAAKAEVQFTKSVDKIKAALPISFLVGGENPLLLLHSALSKGVHELSDDECLLLANDIRAVLNEFSERLSAVIKGGKEINAAILRLKPKRI